MTFLFVGGGKRLHHAAGLTILSLMPEAASTTLQEVSAMRKHGGCVTNGTAHTGPDDTAGEQSLRAYSIQTTKSLITKENYAKAHASND